MNLIDGNIDTTWVSRGQAQANVEPVWIRIDLAKEGKIGEIVLVPRSNGQGIPSELTIKISRDAWHWTIAHETINLATPTKADPIRFELEDTPLAKQIWIIGT